MLPLLLSDVQLGGWFWLLLIYGCGGMGRCIFEGVNKAVFADMFVGQEEEAFAAGIVQSGGAAAIAFFCLGNGVPVSTRRAGNGEPQHPASVPL